MKKFYQSTIVDFSHKPVLRYLLILLIGMLPTLALAQTITGTVFRDFNADGAYTAIPVSGTFAYGEPGVGGVRVTAYNASGAVSASAISSTVAASMGAFTLNVGAATGPFRVEFTGLSTSDFDGAKAAANNTSVQFAAAGASGINFGLNYPADFCQTNPELAINCYVYGNQTSGPNSTSDVIVSFPYNAGSRSLVDGSVTPTAVYDSPNSHSLVVDASKVGTTYGLAYAPTTRRLYAAAYFKKHSGFGAGADGVASTSLTLSADDPGAIYVLTPAGSVTATYTIPNATGNAHDYADFNLDNGNTAWDAVGKTSLGGMDLSDDDKTLYVMNLENRRLYSLNALTGAAIANQSIPLSFSGCPAADMRPWAVEYYKGKIYVGIICSAQSTSLVANLDAYVFTADPTTLAFSSEPVFRFGLDYPRGKAASTGPADWKPWVNVYTNINTAANDGTPNITNARLTYPMPLLTSIAIDKGDMKICLRDRIADIAGNNAKDNPNQPTNLYQARHAGDILRAQASSSGWVLESNGRTLSGEGTSFQNTDQGPGGAEFYHGDSYPLATGGLSGTTGIGANHDEVSLGSVLQLAGQPDVLAVVYDPVVNNGSDGFHDAGARWMSNSTGAWAQSYRIYAGDGSAGSSNFGKGGGLGEVVAFCNPAPIQIGNRVWNDLNNNGVQDPGEPTLGGVAVVLKGPGLPPAGTTVTTGTNGEYYFSNATGTNATGFVYNLTGLTSGSNYSLCFPPTSGTLTLSSKANSATGTNSDAIDTDPNAAGIISFTLGQAGQNNFTYDAAYAPAPPCILSLTATPGTCNSANNQYTVSGTVNFTSTPGGTLTISDYGANTAVKSMTLSVPANATSIAFSLSGITSGGRNHTITASFSNTVCGTQSLTYISPVSCTAAPCVGTNLLQNPSFEQGFPIPPVGQQMQVPPPSWVGGTADNNPNAFAAPDGYAFGFSGDNGTLCQSVSATAGGTYNLIFFAGVHQANGQTVTLSFLNSSSAVLGTPQTFTSTYILESTNSFGGPYSLSGVAPAGTTQVRVCAVSAVGTGSNFWSKIDNLCLTTATVACKIAVTATPTICNSATNQYTVSGSISLTGNTAGGTATITDGAKSMTVSVPASATSVAYSLTGLTSGTGSHTVTVSLTGCGTASVTYAAPASCLSATLCAGSTYLVLADLRTGLHVFDFANPNQELRSCFDLGIKQGEGIVVDYTNNKTYFSILNEGVVQFDGITKTVSSSFSTTNQSGAILDVALSLDNQSLFVASINGLFKYTTTGTLLGNVSPNTRFMWGVAVNPINGRVFTTEGYFAFGNGMSYVSEIDPVSLTVVNSNVVSTTTNNHLGGFVGLSFALDGTFWVVKRSSTANSSDFVQNYTSAGTLLKSCPIGNTNPGGDPNSVNALAAWKVIMGPDNNLYVSSSDAQACVWKIDPSTCASSVFVPQPGTGYSKGIAFACTDQVCLQSACSLTATATPTICNSATNQYTVNGVISLTGNAAGGTATITDGTKSMTVSVAASATSVAYSLTGLTSDAASHTVTVNLTGCGSAVATYMAPASCTVAPPALAVVVGTLVCNTATNNYTTTSTVSLTNAPAGTLTLTDNGGVVGTVSVTAGQTTASFTLSGVSGSSPASHSVVATLSNGVTVVASTSYATPASCTVCSLSLTTSMLSNGQIGTAYSETLTTSGGTAPLSYTLSSGSLPAGLSLNPATGVISGTPTAPAGTASFTVKVTDAKNCTALTPLTITTSAEPVCELTATATPTICNSVNNAYTVTGTISATNAPASQTLTVSVGSNTTTIELSGNGPVSYTLTGLTSDGLTKTVSVVSSASACGMTSVTYAAPASCTVAPALASLGNFVFEDVNRNGIQDGGDLPIGGATVTLLQNGSAIATTTTSASGLYSFTGLTPGVPYSVSFTTPSGFSTSTSANVGDDALDSDAVNGLTGPYTLTAGENNPTVDAGFVRPAAPTPTLKLTKLVSVTKAQLGDIVSYTIVLVNTGVTAATSVVVSDTYSAGLTLVPGSVSVSAGSFTPGMQGGQWAIASLPANATATLVYSVSITAEGIAYNTASIPGDEAKVCTSVPFKVCKGTPFSVEVNAPAGYSRYQWYLTTPTGTTLVSDMTATSANASTVNNYTITQVGAYNVVVNEGVAGACPDGSCCPVIVEEVEVPLYTAMGKNPTCVGTTPQANGEIKLMNLGVDPTEYLYQVSSGSSFSASTVVSGSPAPVPADGVVGRTLVQGTYTVRVWVLIDGQPSCPRDVVVVLTANCACPEEICVPVVIRKSKSLVR